MYSILDVFFKPSLIIHQAFYQIKSTFLFASWCLVKLWSVFCYIIEGHRLLMGKVNFRQAVMFLQISESFNQMGLSFYKQLVTVRIHLFVEHCARMVQSYIGRCASICVLHHIPVLCTILVGSAQGSLMVHNVALYHCHWSGAQHRFRKPTRPQGQATDMSTREMCAWWETSISKIWLDYACYLRFAFMS